MAKKRGKGGYGSENYDPNTGKYVKEEQGNVFHAGVGQSVKDILEDLKSGFYDEPENDVFPSKIFENDDDNDPEEDETVWQQKADLVAYIQNALDEYNTNEYMLKMNFPPATIDDFIKWGKECSSRLSFADQDGFYNGYKGAATACFEFNKALRFGFDKFYKLYPQFLNSPNLSPSAIENRARKLDKCTSVFSFPRDTQVYRYIDTAPLLSNFEKYGVFDGLETQINQYNLKQIKDGYDLHDLANRLKNLIGMKMPPDNAFMSFSTVPGYSHMERVLAEGQQRQKQGIKNKEEKGQERKIKMFFNCPAGTKVFITNYQYESEGLFNRNIGFFLQDVSVGKVIAKNGEEIELIFMQFGVER